jgi:hypothetical protein
MQKFPENKNCFLSFYREKLKNVSLETARWYERTNGLLLLQGNFSFVFLVLLFFGFLLAALLFFSFSFLVCGR